MQKIKITTSIFINRVIIKVVYCRFGNHKRNYLVLRQWSRQLASSHKMSLFSQIKAICHCRMVSRIGVSEYYELKLFDRVTFPEPQRCIGRVLSAKIDRVLNSDAWRATANNKILNYSLLAHYNLPIPTTVATYKAMPLGIANEKKLNDTQQLSDFFATNTDYPLFIKPVHGSYGQGTFSLTAFDHKKQSFSSKAGADVELASVLAVADKPKHQGLLIQRCLMPHPRVLDTVGPNTSCVRFILIKDGADVFIHRAFWKIATKGNITDNFSYGKHGNLLADIDVETGKVTRVIGGLWPDTTQHVNHPDSGMVLLGFQLPDWQQAVAQCIQASNIFSGLSLQSWDVAFCVDGPVLMELNTEPNLEVPQMLSEQAFLDDRLLAILKQRGW